jgi:hypothetical protein
VRDCRVQQRRLLVVQRKGDLLERFLFTGVERKILAKLLVADGFKAKAGHIHGDVGQFEREQLRIPLGHLRDFVVSQPKRLDLILGQLVRDDAGDSLESQLFGVLEAGMPGDDHAILGDDQRHQEAEALDAGSHGVHRAVVLARVALVRINLREGNLFDVHTHTSFYAD